MLHPDLAEKIVREVQRLITEEIIVVNTEGIIMASTNTDRIGTFHEGALITSQQKKKLIITEKDTPQLKGVKSGINLPIFFQHEVIGVIGITGDPKSVTPFGEIIRKMTELLISENYYGEQFDYHSRGMETFVLEWLQAKEPSADLLERARALTINLKLNRTAVIIEFEQRKQPLSRDMWSSILNSFSINKNDVVTRSGNERIILLIDCSESLQPTSIKHRLEQFLLFMKNNFEISAFAGVGQCAASSNLHQSYAQAERALKLARRNRGIIFDEELILEMVTGEITPEIKAEYIQRSIAPLLTENDLLETLKELFKQNHSLKNTAQALHIHINTLHYRLKKIEELTHLNPNTIHDLFCLYLAVLFLDEKPNFKRK
ncbi:sugar diacid recognition domain-containing protein [Neobacillus sp. DY30]|uniref:CdaR family transcriptional regulator n=1 Tax=Neobacillus sp. DY30 TaxID=3047871 RepID=UPI0024C0B91B|nr:sugar diacid recognition domain-containing protein [Neobacillus sp. DY30]WHY00150.1 sugar diacid recognition domain-containing protein [Neobacillus sp. DY30]